MHGVIATNRIDCKPKTIACLDKLFIRTEQEIPEERVKANCGHTWEINKRSKYDGKYTSHLITPNEKAIEIIERYNPKISRIEGAIYFITKNREENTELADYLAEHLVLKNLRYSHHIIIKGRMIYYMQRNKRRINKDGEEEWRWREGSVAVIYDDKPCKLDSKKYRYAVKFEERFQGKRGYKKIDAWTVREAFEFDWLSYFEERIELFTLDYERIWKERRLTKEVIRKLGTVASAQTSSEERFFMQEFVRKIGRGRNACFLRKLDTKWLFQELISVILQESTGRVG